MFHKIVFDNQASPVPFKDIEDNNYFIRIKPDGTQELGYKLALGDLVRGFKSEIVYNSLLLLPYVGITHFWMVHDNPVYKCKVTINVNRP